MNSAENVYVNISFLSPKYPILFINFIHKIIDSNKFLFPSFIIFP